MSRFSSPTAQYLDGNAIPLPGFKLSFFQPGTTTPKDTFSDSALTTANTNPVIGDADARTPDIFLDGIYKVVLKDADDVTIWTRDPVGDTTSGQFQSWINDNIYIIPDIVKGSDNEYYRSLENANQGNDPTTTPASWESLEFGRIWNTNIAYALGDQAIGSDGMLYFSLVASNTGNNPTSETTVTNWRAADQLRTVNAAGTADAITATYIPAVLALKDGLIVKLRASGANTITNPTFSPNAAAAKQIKNLGNTALLVGSISGAGHELLLSFSTTNDCWELLNPVVEPEFAARRASSSEFAITSGGLITWTHGLGAKPLNLSSYLKCLSATDNYSIGDEVDVTLSATGSGSTTKVNSVNRNSTTVTVRFNGTSSAFTLANKSTGAATNITNSEWELYLEATS